MKRERQVILFALTTFLVAGLSGISYVRASQPSQIEETETPTPVTIGITAEPQPTLYGVMILITPTPETIPPSLQIPDLDKKIKDKTVGAGRKVFGMANLWPASAESPVPAEVDDTINLFWSWLVQREREYFGMSGKYCQMLPSHTSGIPSGGKHFYPDGWYNHPTDQQYSWNDLNAIQYEPLPFEIAIDIYSGSEGPGFVACFSLGIGGQAWTRCKNYGPEALRNLEWSTAPVKS